MIYSYSLTYFCSKDIAIKYSGIQEDIFSFQYRKNFFRTAFSDILYVANLPSAKYKKINHVKDTVVKSSRWDRHLLYICLMDMALQLLPEEFV